MGLEFMGISLLLFQEMEPVTCRCQALDALASCDGSGASAKGNTFPLDPLTGGDLFPLHPLFQPGLLDRQVGRTALTCATALPSMLAREDGWCGIMKPYLRVSASYRGLQGIGDSGLAGVAALISRSEEDNENNWPKKQGSAECKYHIHQQIVGDPDSLNAVYKE